MSTRIGKWGNSAAARLPKETLEAAGLEIGDEVELAVEKGAIVLRAPKRLKTVAELFAEYEAKYGKLEPPGTVDWGPDIGSEILPEDEYSRGEITLEDLIDPDVDRRR